ncbi:MAG TPA: mandelate racemase/muconate lactonizing enzyme family protein [Candidatus Acidoferrales bacterium]|nr:mandelate racemase/muconate lactonizing enzyme family protein [Candidatus Acidoferrales bacterium]
MATQIDNVNVRRLRMPRVDPTWRTSSYAASSIEGFILEVRAGGVVGLGGTAAHPSNISGDDLEAQLNGPVRKILIGADVFEGSRIRESLRAANLHPRATIAADLALYDLLGKLARVPAYVLLGGKLRDRISVVRMVGIKAPDDLTKTVGELVRQGLTHFKVKIGTGLAEDLARIRALREAFGDRIWIGVDGNGAYDVDGAIALSRALEPYRVRLIEQPIDYRDLDGLARLTAASPIPIMADQCVEDVQSALAVCERRAAHVVSIKATKMGFLEDCRKVTEICRAFGVRVHVGGSAVPAVVDVASAHLAAALPGIDDEAEVGEFQAVQGDPFRGAVIRDGRMAMGESPGWGLSLAG